WSRDGQQLAEREATVARQTERLQQLRQVFPWPDDKPDVPIPQRETGWLADGARDLLSRELGAQTKLVVELGAWLGESTRFIADCAPHAAVVTIDHWQGSPEHQARPQWQSMLPTLYETFLAMCWSYRERIVPLKMTTQDALQSIADRGLQPD